MTILFASIWPATFQQTSHNYNVHPPDSTQDVNSFLGVYASDLLPLSMVQTCTLITTPSLAYTGRPYIFKILIAPQTATFSIPTAAILLFPPSKISYDAIVQSGNTAERNSKELPLQSAANTAASSLCTWTGATTPNNLWFCLLLKTPIETYTSYSARNLALRCANSAQEGNAVRG